MIYEFYREVLLVKKLILVQKLILAKKLILRKYTYIVNRYSIYTYVTMYMRAKYQHGIDKTSA